MQLTTQDLSLIRQVLRSEAKRVTKIAETNESQPAHKRLGQHSVALFHEFAHKCELLAIKIADDEKTDGVQEMLARHGITY